MSLTQSLTLTHSPLSLFLVSLDLLPPSRLNMNTSVTPQLVRMETRLYGPFQIQNIQHTCHFFPCDNIYSALLYISFIFYPSLSLRRRDTNMKTIYKLFEYEKKNYNWNTLKKETIITHPSPISPPTSTHTHTHPSSPTAGFDNPFPLIPLGMVMGVIKD